MGPFSTDLDINRLQVEPFEPLRGGMAVVYRARATPPYHMRGRTFSQVAIKTMETDSPERAQQFLERFEREFEFLKSLSHSDQIVTLLDSGRWNGRPAIVLEWCSNGTLSDNLELFSSAAGAITDASVPADKQRKMSDHFTALVHQLLGGLESMHQRSIIHRDFKPENVLIRGDLGAVIADLGVSRSTRARSATRFGSVGTLGWQDPWLWGRAEQASPRSDIWPLALLLYTIVCRQEPYENLPQPVLRDSGGGIGAAFDEWVARSAPVASWHRKFSELPRGRQLYEVLARALSLQPAARPVSMMEFRRQLAAVWPWNNLPNDSALSFSSSVETPASQEVVGRGMAPMIAVIRDARTSMQLALTMNTPVLITRRSDGEGRLGLNRSEVSSPHAMLLRVAADKVAVFELHSQLGLMSSRSSPGGYLPWERFQRDKFVVPVLLGIPGTDITVFIDYQT